MEQTSLNNNFNALTSGLAGGSCTSTSNKAERAMRRHIRQQQFWLLVRAEWLEHPPKSQAEKVRLNSGQDLQHVSLTPLWFPRLRS